MIRFSTKQTTNLAALLLAALLAGAPSATAQSPRFPFSAGYTDGADMEIVRDIAPGVVHQFESHSSPTLTIHSITIDMGRGDLVLETEGGQDRLLARETVPDMVARNQDPAARPIVAINAGFWGAGNIPVNMFVDEGTIWKGPRCGANEGRGTANTIFAFDDQGNHWIGSERDVYLSLKGPAEGETLAIDKVNFHEDSSYAVAYTWPLGDETAAIRENQKQIVLELPGGEWLPNAPAKVRVKRVDDGPKAPLDRNTVVIHADTPLPDFIREGAELTLDARMPGLPGKVVGVVGGIPRILKDGVVDPVAFAGEENQRASFATDLHPRTAIGIKEDGRTLVIAVADGRQSRRSVGINLVDLGNHLKEQGCVQGVNLDGGGSSTLVVRGELVNFPSDPGGPRSVNNGIILRRTAPIGPPEHLLIEPADTTIMAGSQLVYTVRALDAAGEPVDLSAAGLEWSIDEPAIGRIEGGTLTTTGTGDATITVSANLGSRTITESTTVRPRKPDTVTIEPPALLLEPGEQVALTFKASSRDAGDFFPAVRLPAFQAPPCVQFDPGTATVKAVEKGAGLLTFQAAGSVYTLPLAVDTFEVEPALSFDTAPADPATLLELTRAREDGTSVELDSVVFHEGTASWKLTYAMAGGGTTRIGLNLDAPIPGEPLAIGLWVYGDGNGQWLRGDLVDARGEVLKLDFTNAQEGIDWKDEWRFLRVSLTSAQGPGARALQPPFRLKNIYIAQPQEAAKRDGVLRIDGLCGVNLPDGLQP